MLWIVIGSFLAALILAFGLGANDVSNAFATSIGAKVITLRTACFIASIAEIAGSIGLGGLVTESIIKTTIIPDIMNPIQTMLVMFTSLISVGLWLLIATWLKLPVSATHAVVSSIIGATLVANSSAVNWSDITNFILAWFISPVLSGIISILVYLFLAKAILFTENPFRRGIFAIPYIYVMTISVNVVLILYQIIKKTCTNTSECVILISASSVIALLVAIGTYIFSRWYIVPLVKTRIYLKFSSKADSDPSHVTKLQQEEFLNSASGQRLFLQSEQLFAFLQILSAVFTSFVHGSNDVSNSVGPLYGLYNAYQRHIGGQEINSSSLITFGLLAYGGIGMVLGLYVWGSRVIETIGENLTVMSPSRGFSIELGSALTVLIASMLKLSVSTTHCKVGSIVCVGFFSSWLSSKVESPSKLEDGKGSPTSISNEDVSLHETPLAKGAINPKLILTIVASWICTIPFAGFLSAGMYTVLAYFLKQF